MRALKILSICLIISFFVGCQSSKDVRDKHLKEKGETDITKPSALSIFTEDVTPLTTVTPESTGTTDVSTGKGMATAQEKQQAVKGESIPLQPIPLDKKFKSPSEFSPELAQIFSNVYFNYDRYDIGVSDVPVLIKISQYLLQNPNMEILIEGHCDERGTREYNLVLGEQRSLSVRRFLVEQGVSPKRLYTVSYGKDNPVDPRSNEEAWAKNRRVEFKIAE
jgi:peptidoglycan-associated lipoprotein